MRLAGPAFCNTARPVVEPPPMNRGMPMSASAPVTAISAGSPSLMTYSIDAIAVVFKWRGSLSRRAHTEPAQASIAQVPAGEASVATPPLFRVGRPIPDMSERLDLPRTTTLQIPDGGTGFPLAAALQRLAKRLAPPGARFILRAVDPSHSRRTRPTNRYHLFHESRVVAPHRSSDSPAGRRQAPARACSFMNGRQR